MEKRESINVLILEDVKSDAQLTQLYLDQLEFESNSKVTDNRSQFEYLLSTHHPDIILSDFNLPSFSGFEALKIVQSLSLDIPFIFVTGTLGEETAVHAIKAGATDFIVKERIHNLPAAILRAFREQKEKKLRWEQESRFKGLIEHSHNPVMLFGEDRIVTYVSPAVHSVLGYEVDEFIGKNVSEIVHPDDRTKRDEAFQELLKGKVEQVSLTQRFLCKDGQERYVDAVILDQREVPGVNCFTSNFRDVHETILAKKKIEEQQMLLDKSNRLARLGSWEFDLESMSLYWSDVAKEIYEVAEDYEPDFNAALDFYESGESRETIQKAIRGTLNSGDAYDLELKLVTAKGNSKWVRAIGESDFQNGKKKRVFGSIQDITELKEARFQLEKTLRDLERKNAELENMVYITSHDLQEPMLTVLSSIDLLKEELPSELNENSSQLLNYSLKAAQRMEELVTGLLNYLRLGTDPAVSVSNPEELIREVIEEMHASITNKGAKILLGKLPDRFMVDKSEMKHLFQNLISNGIKFQKKHSQPEMEINAKEENGQITFSVTDNGIGIKQNDFDSVFQIFKRLNQRGSYEGTGVGMAACKKIIESRGGRIWIESTPGAGTTFYFTMPTGL